MTTTLPCGTSPTDCSCSWGGRPPLTRSARRPAGLLNPCEQGGSASMTSMRSCCRQVRPRSAWPTRSRRFLLHIGSGPPTAGGTPTVAGTRSGICAALRVDGKIETSCPDCGERIDIAVRDQRPDDRGRLPLPGPGFTVVGQYRVHVSHDEHLPVGRSHSPLAGRASLVQRSQSRSCPTWPTHGGVTVLTRDGSPVPERRIRASWIVSD